MVATQTQERALKRADGVRELVKQRGLLDVLAALEELHSDGNSGPSVRLRTPYIRNSVMPYGDLWSQHAFPSFVEFDERRRPAERILPPLARLLLSQGVALEFHLVALFVAQAQARSGARWENEIPITKRSNGIAWVDLMAVSAKSRTGGGRSSSYTANKTRQLRASLNLLSNHKLVDIGDPGVRNRYEGFKLLSEDAVSSAASSVEYRVPREHEAVINVPFQFFTRGWVYLLTKSEIAAYFMWLSLSAESEWVTGLWRQRAGLFGLSRDVHDTTQALAAYGLVDVLPSRERRQNGTWRNFNAGDKPYGNKIRVNRRGLWRSAPKTVEGVLRKTAALGKWSRVVGE
ncbi:hypothetical protein [Streptomyces europaeiscabiei]|uniref:hypothetical protein n=1 Tax=Streptomyces europaeiscabiei TaxID=146819 RepID=UPI0029A36396|nr:hypothetical protein [Streptomyces europaeiscabiei]MDX3844994.1 hypothetical protein [Streptomyces europaeiscabiei]